MESALRSLMSSSAACKPSCNASHHATKVCSFPAAPAAPPQPQPPLLPLPAGASPLHEYWPASRPVPVAKKPRHHAAPSAKTAPVAVAAAPSKKRVAPATTEAEEVGWAGTDSLYSVSPPPSSVPMPTSSLLATVAAARKAPTACAVEVAGAGAGVDVGATDELRRLLRL
ncbi:hypothetical protein ACP4OV_023489 [Aristida adscensionis]